MMRRLCLAVLATVSLFACSPAPENPGAIPAPPNVAEIPDDAEVTASGLASKVLTPGTGTTHPRPESVFVAHYTGWTTDGVMFDSSVVKGAPLSGYPLNGMIPGWIEGMQLMVAGEQRRFWIPGKLAYDGMAGRPQGMLVFDVELIDFK